MNLSDPIATASEPGVPYQSNTGQTIRDLIIGRTALCRVGVRAWREFFISGSLGQPPAFGKTPGV
jgi:hypothetical protein